jgi:hypothetical protein
MKRNQMNIKPLIMVPYIEIQSQILFVTSLEQKKDMIGMAAY